MDITLQENATLRWGKTLSESGHRESPKITYIAVSERTGITYAISSARYLTYYRDGKQVNPTTKHDSVSAAMAAAESFDSSVK